MLDVLRYEAGASFGVYDLNGADAVAGSPDSLRDASWSYEIGRAGIEGASREPEEVRISCVMTGGDFPSLRRDADRDVELGVAGRLYVNGMFKRANLTGWRRTKAVGGAAVFEVSAVLHDGCWMRERRVGFAPASAGGEGPLDLPHDLPHDLAAPPATTWVESSEWCRCMVGFVIYGPCTSPYVMIGGTPTRSTRRFRTAGT